MKTLPVRLPGAAQRRCWGLKLLPEILSPASVVGNPLEATGWLGQLCTLRKNGAGTPAPRPGRGLRVPGVKYHLLHARVWAWITWVMSAEHLAQCGTQRPRQTAAVLLATRPRRKSNNWPFTSHDLEIQGIWKYRFLGPNPRQSNPGDLG